MKTLNDLLEILNTRYPFDSAEHWDNSGFILGDLNQKLNKVYLSLDVDSTVLDTIEPYSILITHHPLIFSPLKIIDFNGYEGKLIKKLIQKNISYIALHTNYDKYFLGDYFVTEILKENIIESTDFLNFYLNNKPKENLLNDLSRKLGLNYLQYTNGHSFSKIAVCNGSGGSLLKEAKKHGADVLLTGDITYHIAKEAEEYGITLIDITHFHSEKYFGIDLANDFGFISLKQKNPFKLALS
jgi:dinuclear metal center YbgI/SA1388 family protein